MNTRLTPEQLGQLVAEVERLSQRREAELDRQQVEGILQELNLPTDLLDDALMQLQRQKALAVQQRRNRWLVGGAIAIFIGAVATISFSGVQQKTTLNRIQVYGDRLTLSNNKAVEVRAIDNQDSPELFYEVTLQNAPVGQRLTLSCNWIDSRGNIARQNRWTTRQIDRQVWNTHCRYQVHPGTITGDWTVRMFLGDRPLDDATFTVK